MTLDFCGQKPPWLVVGKAHNILEVIESLFAAGGRHIYLLPEATRLSKSHVPTKIETYGQLSYVKYQQIIYLQFTITGKSCTTFFKVTKSVFTGIGAHTLQLKC